MGSIGSYAGLFRLKNLKKNCKDPVLIASTDGVGTKLVIAQQMKNHDNVGIDLVAMCNNDILCSGAEPLTFLDYFACGRLDDVPAATVIESITKGCKDSPNGCALVGGETAEMPGMYKNQDYDLAGYAMGIAEFSELLPKKNLINIGDIIIGLPSNGLHSNGFSLIHQLMSLSGNKFTDLAPFSDEGKSFGEEFLKPTNIYVRDVLSAISSGYVKALAHITGGGLWDNIPRIFELQSHCGARGKAFQYSTCLWMALQIC